MSLSTKIKFRSVSVGSSNLPVVEEIVAGFPATDLYALYLAEEGANGQAHAGAFLDSSGHDRHAVLAPLWGQPIKESYGFTVPVNGIPIHTPLTLGGSFSVVMAVQIAAEGASAVNYANLLSPKASINVNIATGANPSNKRFAVNALLQQTSGALGNVAIFAGDGSNIPGVTPANQRAPVPGSSGNVPKVIGLAFDKSAGALYLTDGLGRQAVTVSAEALKTWMDQYLTAPDTLSLGLYRHTANTLLLGGKWMGAAVYSAALSVEQLHAVMQAMQNRVAARGVVFP